MARLTLRTLLAYIDDTLEPAQARALGLKVAASEPARDLIERIKRVTRRRGLKSPVPTAGDDDVSDPNTVAEYLSDNLDSEQLRHLEETCLKSDVHLAEVAAVHQILTLLLTEPVRVPPRAHQRMYALVDPPAGQPQRRPSKASSLAGAMPPQRQEPDDADSTYLLGLSQYTSASTGNRLALVGAVVLASVVLVGAVLMAVWNKDVEPTAGPSQPSPPVAMGGLVLPPAAKPTAAKTENETVEAPMPRERIEPAPMPPVEPPPPLVPILAPPLAGREAIGKVESQNKLVLTRPNDGPEWVRVDAAEPVTSQDELLCLPGYMADVGLTQARVTVHLWGNIPDLLSATVPGQRVPLACRLRIHQPPAGFDADVSLLEGRIYVSTKNPDGARVRLRIAEEVWDVRLNDQKADVMVEVVTAFVPGSAYARVGGEKPRTAARLAVTKGRIEFAAPKRFRKAAPVAELHALTWDSSSGQLDGPKAFDRGDVSFARFLDPYLLPEHFEIVNKSLVAFVSSVADPKKVRLAISEQLNQQADRDPVKQGVYRLAVFAEAALASGPKSDDGLKTLIDVLGNETRYYARLAAADALSLWVARDSGNTARLFALMQTKQIPPEEADLLLRLLRGYAPIRRPDPAELDALVNMLSARSLRVRELALWNLRNFVDPSAMGVPGLFTDVAFDGAEFGYDKFLASWKQRIEIVKMRKDDGKEKK